MAATPLSLNQFSGDGALVDTLVAANADGNIVPNYTGAEWVEVFNQDATETTVTFNSQKLSNYGDDSDKAYPVPAGERHKIWLPLPAVRWRDENGALQFTYSKITDLSVGAFKSPR